MYVLNRLSELAHFDVFVASIVPWKKTSATEEVEAEDELDDFCTNRKL